MNGVYGTLDRYVAYNYGYSLAFDDAFDEDDLDLLEDDTLRDFENELREVEEGIEDIDDLEGDFDDEDFEDFD